MEQQICSRCQALEITEEGKVRLSELAERISSLFIVYPDIMMAWASDGTATESFAFGVWQRPPADEGKALDVITGKIWEMFQRVFGEKQTGRKIYWRERPTLMSQEDFYSRRVNRVCWMRLAIPGLTDAEREALVIHVPEGVGVDVAGFTEVTNG